MPIIKLPANAQLCPHDANHRHPTWNASDGEWGLCMMAPAHIENCIKMLVRSIRYMRTSEDVFYPWTDDWPQPLYFTDVYDDAEGKLEMFVKERNRRIKLGRWKNG